MCHRVPNNLVVIANLTGVVVPAAGSSTLAVNASTPSGQMFGASTSAAIVFIGTLAPSAVSPSSQGASQAGTTWTWTIVPHSINSIYSATMTVPSGTPEHP